MFATIYGISAFRNLCASFSSIERNSPQRTPQGDLPNGLA
jgi:hypothetical protein